MDIPVLRGVDGLGLRCVSVASPYEWLLCIYTELKAYVR